MKLRKKINNIRRFSLILKILEGKQYYEIKNFHYLIKNDSLMILCEKLSN